MIVLDHTGQLGGAELALARLVSSVDPDRFAVSVVLFDDGPFRQRLEADGVAVSVRPLAPSIVGLDRHSLLRNPLRAGRTMLQLAGYTWRLGRQLRAQGADLVVANSLKSAVVAVVAARLTRAPLAWHLHDRLSEDYLPPVVSSVMRALARHAPDVLIANSQTTLDCVQPIAAERCAIAYPGLPEAGFEPSSQPSTPTTRVIGIVGRISPTKGQEIFLRAAADVLRTGRSVRFEVIGTSLFNEREYENGLHRLVTELGIAASVDFVGWVDDVDREMRRLDVVVHASPVAEPFGQVVVEAMAAGVPVIGADAGGVREILDPADSAKGTTVRRSELGQLVLPGDVASLAEAMTWTIDHRDEALEMAARARASARQRFSATRTAAVVQDAWSNALRDPAGTATSSRTPS